VVLDKLQSILGPNLVQWGADFISQKPGRLHRWHVDADCLHCEGLTVWLALDNLNEMTAMKVIAARTGYKFIRRNLAVHVGWIPAMTMQF
jgi:hypothetical protein